MLVPLVQHSPLQGNSFCKLIDPLDVFEVLDTLACVTRVGPFKVHVVALDTIFAIDWVLALYTEHSHFELVVLILGAKFFIIA